jgi:tetratricopeptide (TPR) repeat protein
MGHLRSSALLAMAAFACASSPEVDPRYRPAESVLEVLAVLQRHVPDDTYRFDPARDFTGRNVYRSSLLRLENLERMHEDGLRAGHMDGVIAFGKGRALERLGAFDLAAEAYRRAAEREPDLAEEALRSARVCEGILEAQAVTGGVGQAHLLPSADLSIASPQIVFDRFEERAGLLAWQEEVTAGTHHVAVVREQIERTHVERARYFVRLRSVLPDGELRAVAELQRVVSDHGESRHALRHLLDLANLYSELSAEYVAQYPPESIDFDPAHFRDLVDSGARIYEMVAARDGTSEKIEATRRLEAFLAFALGVDRDRFTP